MGEKSQYGHRPMCGRDEEDEAWEKEEEEGGRGGETSIRKQQQGLINF